MLIRDEKGRAPWAFVELSIRKLVRHGDIGEAASVFVSPAWFSELARDHAQPDAAELELTAGRVKLTVKPDTNLVDGLINVEGSA